MTIRRLGGAAGALLFAFGLGAFAPTTGRAQSYVPLPEEHPIILVIGCLGWINHHGYVLSRPMMNQTTVSEATCLVSEGDPMIRLRGDLIGNGLTRTTLGQYVMVSGRMGDQYPTHPDRLQKIDVLSMSPAVVAQVAY